MKEKAHQTTPPNALAPKWERSHWR